MAANLAANPSIDGPPLHPSHAQSALPPHYSHPHAHAPNNLNTAPAAKQMRQDGLLRDSFFADWKDDATADDLADPTEMQKQDPLGIQIWKLYSKTKTQLPNKERMDNLSWRMMSMNLKRKEQEQARWVAWKHPHGTWSKDHGPRERASTDRLGRLNQQQQQAASAPPSGIAQLRQSHGTTQDAQSPPSDVMNIDDFIFPASVATPGESSSPPTPSSNAATSAIPIKTKKDIPSQAHQDFPPSAPPHGRMRNHEFDYVQRRVRKTSIDETRVWST